VSRISQNDEEDIESKLSPIPDPPVTSSSPNPVSNASASKLPASEINVAIFNDNNGGVSRNSWGRSSLWPDDIQGNNRVSVAPSTVYESFISTENNKSWNLSPTLSPVKPAAEIASSSVVSKPADKSYLFEDISTIKQTGRLSAAPVYGGQSVVVKEVKEVTLPSQNSQDTTSNASLDIPATENDQFDVIAIDSPQEAKQPLMNEKVEDIKVISNEANSTENNPGEAWEL
jgi:hypothetical protein